MTSASDGARRAAPHRAETPATTPQPGCFRFRPMRLRDAFAASRWRYPGEYAIYNLTLPPLLVAAALRAPLARWSGMSYYAVEFGDDPLVGVFSLSHVGDDVEIGVGLRPDYTGRGYGLEYVLEGLRLAQREMRPATFSLYVAIFNLRAIKVYERAGFQPGPRRLTTIGGKRVEEIRMARSATEPL